jgi:hypothetical protein
LSSTRPASHHRIIRSGETAAQRCDRVSGRHRWVISSKPAHPALVSEADFIVAQDIHAARGPSPEGDLADNTANVT